MSKRAAGFVSIVLRLFFVISMVLVAACADQRAVTPDGFDTFIRPGERGGFALNVSLTSVPPSYAPLDIVLLIDATGSMRNIIDTMRQNAVTIIQDIRRANPNTAFGVASFGDYGSSDPVWTLDQEITQDTTKVVAGLGRIRMLDGGDYPEAYSRALYEMLFVNWRPGARRYVVLFGDAPAHDPDFYGKNLGIDPGRDGIPGSPDDLRFRDVVRELASNKITVIGIYDRGPWYNRKPFGDETKMGFEFVAKETGGLAVPVSAATDVPGAIRQGFTEVKPPIPVLRAGGEYANWLTASSPEAFDAKGLRYRFAISVSPPNGTASGIYEIPLRVLVGESVEAGEIGRSIVRVRIGWLYYSWRWLLVAVLLLLIAGWTLLRALMRGLLMPAGMRMVSNRAEVGLLWRGTVLLIIVGLVISVVLVVPDTVAELLRPT